MTPEKPFREIKQLNLPEIDQEVLDFWEQDQTFHKSVSTREGKDPFVFYEGPPSANGMPGIHHVLSRTIKDLFCRYKTLKGYKVERKGGWDTHGLPVELSVEKSLGITKEDIGTKISIAEYNATCRKEVMKFKDAWDDLTRKMGYWVDLDDPYITFENDYIETLWWILKQFHEKGLLYKGYTIQPYSPGAGTGLSSHELNLPGCYREVKDTTVVAQFKVEGTENEFFLAWTTTPWTLPSNTALAVGAEINYQLIDTYNPYTFERVKLWIAEDLRERYFNEKAGFAESDESAFASYEKEAKPIPYRIIQNKQGKEVAGTRYEQLLPYAQPEDGDAFKVITGEFVTTEDGTGIVHLAPSFGADDLKVARENGIGSLTLVDKQGRFVDEVTDFAGRYVKNYQDEDPYNPVDVDIVVKLKQENRAFKIEKYEHSYPHCWRTDKPVIYYPLNSWFIKTTALKERLVELNQTINWQPEFTGSGRFGNWLENLVDWNLSRSRYWGTPLPVWKSEEGSYIHIGTRKELMDIDCYYYGGKEYEDFLEELRSMSLDDFAVRLRPYNPTVYSEEDNTLIAVNQLKKALEQREFLPVDWMLFNVPFEFYRDKLIQTSKIIDDLDLHRPYVDRIAFYRNNQLFYREPDLIDVWFDSGAMPYAQWHYPFENKERLPEVYPADFIAEGVDQTRGWFFTLHAIAVLLFDSVAYKNVVSNGLVLDKNGNKMSKRLGNAVDPFVTIKKHGADATRWYMMGNSQPWENLKFDEAGIEEVKRKFFGTLFNSYSFFALYANVDGFRYGEEEVPLDHRQEIDRWIISLLNSLIKDVDEYYSSYEPTKAARAIQTFVTDHLSNWYVRLCRRRFWKGEYTEDKIAAYQTLYRCLEVVAQLMSPVAPFFSEHLFQNLNKASNRLNASSVHLTLFPEVAKSAIDKPLEERMQLAQDISSMVLSLRKKENIKVRQPLQKVLVPVLDQGFKEQLQKVEDLILSEVNVKEMEYIEDASGVFKKKIKPDFKKLGRKMGPRMKLVAQAIGNFSQQDIVKLESEQQAKLHLEDGSEVEIALDEVEISAVDIPGWLVATEGDLMVALDITITDDLQAEGNARELINRIQRVRKDKNFNVTDKIKVQVEENEEITGAINRFKDYICTEILAEDLQLTDSIAQGDIIDVNDVPVKVSVKLI